MVELADTPDLGSGAARHGGSSPPSRSNFFSVLELALFLLALSACSSPGVSSLQISANLPYTSNLDDLTTFNELALIKVFESSEQKLKKLQPLMREFQSELAIRASAQSCQIPVLHGKFIFTMCEFENPTRTVLLRTALLRSELDLLSKSTVNPSISQLWLDFDLSTHSSKPTLTNATITGLRISPSGDSAIIRVADPAGQNSGLFVFNGNGLAQLFKGLPSHFDWLSDEQGFITLVPSNSNPKSAQLSAHKFVAGVKTQVTDQIEISFLSGVPSGSISSSGERVFVASELPGESITAAIELDYVTGKFKKTVELGAFASADHSPGSSLYGVRNQGDREELVEIGPGGQELTLALDLPLQSHISDLRVISRIAVVIVGYGWSYDLLLINLDSREQVTINLPAPSGLRFQPGSSNTQDSIALIHTTPGGTEKLVRLSINAANLAKSSVDTVWESDSPLPARHKLHRTMLEIPLRDGSFAPTLLTTTDRAAPLSRVLLSAYCAYGELPRYVPTAQEKLLLNEGFAIANFFCKGSGFKGPSWHQAGLSWQKLEQSEAINQVARFISNLKGTKEPLKIILYGRSAGAYNALAAVWSAPELYHGLILDAPFLYPTVLNNPKLRGAISQGMLEYDLKEWGDLVQQQHFSETKSRKSLPPLLAISSINDQIVPYYHVLKLLSGLPPTQDSLLYLTDSSEHHTVDDGAYGRQYQSLIAAWAIDRTF